MSSIDLTRQGKSFSNGYNWDVSCSFHRLELDDLLVPGTIQFWKHGNPRFLGSRNIRNAHRTYLCTMYNMSQAWQLWGSRVLSHKERRINLGCTIHEKTTILRVAPEHMWFFCRFIILSFYVFFVYEILHAHVITYHHPNAGTGCRLLSRRSAATL